MSQTFIFRTLHRHGNSTAHLSPATSDIYSAQTAFHIDDLFLIVIGQPQPGEEPCACRHPFRFDLI